MSATLVDANVIIDVLSRDPAWEQWSTDSLAAAADTGTLAINPVIYAEVSFRYTMIEELERDLPAEDFRREPIPWVAAFLAGKAFAAYRRRGGGRRSPLPDFFIGAHAAVAQMTLLTRDPSRYRSYFPRLKLIAP